MSGDAEVFAGRIRASRGDCNQGPWYRCRHGSRQSGRCPARRRKTVRTSV